MKGKRFLYGDTETTGLYTDKGDRVVEVALVEFVDGYPTGGRFHRYCDPEREMPPEAFLVHGISGEFLRGFPTFDAIAEELLAFTDGATLVFHNAPFDIGFLLMELKRCNRSANWSNHIDTVALARKRLPNGSSVSLDALMTRFKVDASHRVKHGALIDSELLAEVHAHLEGHRSLALEPVQDTVKPKVADAGDEFPEWRFIRGRDGTGGARIGYTHEDMATHRTYVEPRLKNGLWVGIYAGWDAAAALQADSGDREAA